MSREQRIYAILGLVIAVFSCCAAWLLIPDVAGGIFGDINDIQEQPTRDETKVSTPAPDSQSPNPSTTEDSYTVTFVNNTHQRLRLSEVGEIAPQNLKRVDLQTGFHNISVEVFDSETWMYIGEGLRLDVDRELIVECY